MPHAPTHFDPTARTVRVIAGVVVGHAGTRVMFLQGVGPVEPHVVVSRARVPGDGDPLIVLSPDDADKLADELRTAACAARGEPA